MDGFKFSWPEISNKAGLGFIQNNNQRWQWGLIILETRKFFLISNKDFADKEDATTDAIVYLSLMGLSIKDLKNEV